MGEEIKIATTMSSVKDHHRKKRIFTKKYFTEELKNAGAIKIKTIDGVIQMALSKVYNMTVGLVVAAKGTKSFPDSIIVKWIKPGSKVTQVIERQFSMYNHLVQYLREVVYPEDVEKWKVILRTTKYVWPEENDGWSSIFGNETFLNFKIQPEQLLSIYLKEKDVALNSDAKVLPISASSLENRINQSENTCKSHNYESDVLEINKDKLTLNQPNCSDSDTGNQAIESMLVQENNLSMNSACKLDKENHVDHQAEYSEETMYESICKNDAGEVSNLEKNIFRDSRENSLQRLSIEYKDLMEPDDSKESRVVNITDNYSENTDNFLSVCEDQCGLRKREKKLSKCIFSNRKKEIVKMQHESACIEENDSLKKSFSHQFQEDSSQIDINGVKMDEKNILQDEMSTGNTESKETASLPSSKSISEIIIKNKRKKRSMQDINNVTPKSYRVVILPEETQCSFCERITHNIDNCPDRKRIKTLQYSTTLRVKRYKKKRTNSKDMNFQNINSTSSVLKCATGSTFLYKTKIKKTTDILNSSNNICFYAKSEVQTDPVNPKPVKPFISNKWHKSSNNTISMKYDVEKKKKELLSKQIKELKELLNLFTNKKSNMTLEVKKMLLATIKSLQTSIDNIRQQLNNNVLNETPSTNFNSNTVAYKEEESNMKVQNIENESEKEKCKELKGVPSPSSRKKSEVCHSPNSLLSPKKIHDNLPDKNINNNNVTE